MGMVESINYHVGGYIRVEGKSLDDLAQQLGVHRRTLTNKLSGDTEFKASEVVQLARIIGVTPDTLINFDAIAD